MFTSAQFSQQVLQWFDRHGRKNLPWQQQISAYRVWVSEIMLQQTQVTTVVPYFTRFIKRFPDIAALAAAPIDEVLHLWTGLGYYARARNLHRAAQILIEQYQGVFPSALSDIQGLPGIGRSTAGAIASIALGQVAPILDGNVKRVLARYHAVAGWPGRQDIAACLWSYATDYTPKKRTADYTQAMMDIGATVCTRTKPKCTICPLAKHCIAHQQGDETVYPTRKATRILPVKTVQMLILLQADRSVLLIKRPPVGIWGGLWSFPEADPQRDVTQIYEQYGIAKIGPQHALPAFRHTFSHFHLDIQPIMASIKKWQPKVMDEVDIVWYNINKPPRLGLAAPVKQLLLSIP